MNSETFIESMNEKYFEGDLSPTQIKFLGELDINNKEAVDFVEKAFARVSRMNVSAKDCAAFIIWEMASIWPKILPGAWAGIVPPITFPNRHVLLEDYMKKNQWCPLKEGNHVLDMGCGFPPLTAIDLAKRFPKVSVIGADRSFGKYTVTDAYGNYACFKGDGSLEYLQPAAGKVDQWARIFENIGAARREFAEKYLALKAKLPVKENESSFEEFEDNGWTIVRNPLRKYVSNNLSFVQTSIGDDLPYKNLDMIRCMNVLIYFNPPFRKRTLDWACGQLKEGGIFFCGLNWSESISCRFSVYRKEKGVMQLKESSFSTENIRPIESVSYYAFRDDDFDFDQMIRHVLLIRADMNFMDEFNICFDEILQENKVCSRNEMGYLEFMDVSLPPQQFLANMRNSCSLISQQFAEKAAKVLRGLGKKAWVNEIGFVSIAPDLI